MVEHEMSYTPQHNTTETLTSSSRSLSRTGRIASRSSESSPTTPSLGGQKESVSFLHITCNHTCFEPCHLPTLPTFFSFTDLLTPSDAVSVNYRAALKLPWRPCTKVASFTGRRIYIYISIYLSVLLPLSIGSMRGRAAWSRSTTTTKIQLWQKHVPSVEHGRSYGHIHVCECGCASM